MKKLMFSLFALVFMAQAGFAASLTISAPIAFAPNPGQPGQRALIREYIVVAGPDGSLPIDEVIITGGIGAGVEGVGLTHAFKNAVIVMASAGHEAKNSVDSNFSNEFDEPASFHFSSAFQLEPNQSAVVDVYAEVRSDVSYEVASAVSNDPDGVISSITLKSEGRYLGALIGDAQPVSIVLPYPPPPPIIVGPKLFIANTAITSTGSPQDVRMPLELVDGAVYGALIGFRGEHKGYQDIDGDGILDPITASVSFRYEPREGMMAESGEKNNSFRIGTIYDDLVSDNLGAIIVEQVPEWVKVTTIEWATLLYTESGEQEMNGEATITMLPPVPPIEIRVEPSTIVMGDTAKVYIDGGQSPFSVLWSNELDLYTIISGPSDREYLLVPSTDWIKNWPDEDSIQGPIYLSVSDKYYSETVEIIVKARLGDVTGYLGVTALDASFIMRYGHVA